MLPVVTGFRLSNQNRFYKKLLEETRNADKKSSFRYVGDFKIGKNVSESITSDIVLDVNDHDLRSTYELVKVYNKMLNDNESQELVNKPKSFPILNDYKRSELLLGSIGRDESRDSDTTEGSHGYSEVSSQPYVTSPSHIGSTETSPREHYEMENEISEEESTELKDQKPKEISPKHRSISLENEMIKSQRPNSASNHHQQHSQHNPRLELLTSKGNLFPDFVLPNYTDYTEKDHSKSTNASSRTPDARPSTTPRSDRSTPRAERGKETITKNYKTIVNALQQNIDKNLSQSVHDTSNHSQRNKNFKSNTNSKVIEIPLDSLVNIRLMAPQKKYEDSTELQHPRQAKLPDDENRFDSHVPFNVPKKFCKFCKQSVRPHEQYLYGDEVMHRGCMKCAQCQIPLQHQDQKEDKYGNLFCFRCFMTTDASRSVLWT